MKRNYLSAWVGPLALALMWFILLMLVLNTPLSVSHPALSVSTSDVLAAAPEKESGTWVLLGQPDGADVRTLAVAPDDADLVYVGTEDGIYGSSNGGESWSEALNGQMGATEEILIHPVDSNYLYVDREYASSDSGQSWQDIADDFQVDLTNPGTLYQSPYCEAPRKSTNNGADWSLIINGLPEVCPNYAGVFAIDEVDGSTLYGYAPVAVEGSSPTEYAIFRSDDGGANWIVASTALTQPVSLAAIHPTNPAIVYAVTAPINPGELYRSTDWGQTWSSTGFTQISSRLFLIHPTSPNVIYAQTYPDYDLYRSTDGGDSWHSIWAAAGFTTYISSVRVHPSDSETVYVVSSGKLYASENGGQEWSTVLDLSDSIVSAFGVAHRNLTTIHLGKVFYIIDTVEYISGPGCSCNSQSYMTELDTHSTRDDPSEEPYLSSLRLASRNAQSAVTGTTVGNGVLKSTNGGQSWDDVTAGLKGQDLTSVTVNPLTPSVLYVTGRWGSFLESQDDGQNWEVSDFPSLPIFSPAYESDNTIYALFSGIQRSTNGGESWEVITDGIPANESGHIWASDLVINPTEPSILYLAANDYVYKSMNHGTSWITASVGLDELTIRSLALAPSAPNTLYAVARSQLGYAREIYYSSNGASTWARKTDLPSDVYSIEALAIDPTDSQTLIVGTNRGLFKSTDGATSWITPTLQFESAIVSELAIDPLQPQLLYALVNYSEIYRSSDAGSTWELFSGEMSSGIAQGMYLFTPPSTSGTATHSLLAVTSHSGVWRHSYSVSSPGDGDSYEPDDSCSQASPLTTDGTPQQHSFHQQGDSDWAQFTLVEDTIYVIQAVHTSDDADLLLDLYQTCDGEPTNSDDNALGTDARIIFRAEESGTFYAQVTNHDPDAYGPDVTYELSMRSQQEGGVALIVAGNDDNYDLQDNILAAANLAYLTFAQGGVPIGNIRYLSAISDERTDVDEDGTSEVYASSSSANVEEAITSWAAGLADSETPFYLYLVDHGGIDLFRSHGNDDTITPAELDSWLNALEAATNTPVSVIYEACHSGSFIDNTQDGIEEISAPGRVLIAATGRVNDAYTLPPGEGGAYFSDAFFTGLRQNQDLYTSFQWGISAVETTGLWQTPWLDDNGNAVPNDPQDGQLARNRGLASLSLSGQQPPVVDQVIGPTSIQDGLGTISAKVRDDSPQAAEVWTVVYPPSFEEPPPTEEGTTPLLNLPKVTLSDSNQDGEYVGLYEDFTEDGVYRLVVYAKDAEGNLSLPAAMEVQNGGWQLYLPTVRR